MNHETSDVRHEETHNPERLVSESKAAADDIIFGETKNWKELSHRGLLKGRKVEEKQVNYGARRRQRQVKISIRLEEDANSIRTKTRSRKITYRRDSEWAVSLHYNIQHR